MCWRGLYSSGPSNSSVLQTTEREGRGTAPCSGAQTANRGEELARFSWCKAKHRRPALGPMNDLTTSLTWLSTLCLRNQRPDFISPLLFSLLTVILIGHCTRYSYTVQVTDGTGVGGSCRILQWGQKLPSYHYWGKIKAQSLKTTERSY